MRVFICTDSGEQDVAWAEALRGLDHQPLRVSSQFETTKEWFAATRAAAARSECILIGCADPSLPEHLAWLAGYAEPLSIQVIVVSAWEGGVTASNPRNVRYDTFQDAVDNYFSTGRAMNGERALQ